MISSLLALVLATTAGQASDTTRATREAFTTCLRGYVDRSLDGGTTRATFETEFPQQCAAEQSAFRAAVIQRETAARASPADAAEAAGLEIEDARVNFSERFDLAVGPERQAEPAAAATQPAAVAAAELAAEPTPDPDPEQGPE
jgi:hypothetical protein